MTATTIMDLAATLANVAAFLGIPVGIAIFFHDRRLAQKEREQQTYQALQGRYSEFLKLCLERPDLQIHDFARDPAAVLSEDQKKQQMVAFEMMVSMFESAYFLYGQDLGSAFKRRQWTGWDLFIRDWVERADFRKAWADHLGEQFDLQFLAYMNGLMNERGGAA